MSSYPIHPTPNHALLVIDLQNEHSVEDTHQAFADHHIPRL